MTLSVFVPGSTLVLPVRPARDPEPGTPFGDPEGAAPLPTTQLTPGHMGWTVRHDLAADHHALEVVRDGGVVRFDDIALDVRRRTTETYGWDGDDVGSAHAEIRSEAGFRRVGWDVSTTTRTVLTATPTHFRVHAELDAPRGRRAGHGADLGPGGPARRGLSAGV